VTKPTEPADALRLGPQELPELVKKRVIDDPKTIKVLSDPLRMRILRALGEGARTEARVWSVKQLAEALKLPPGKLYWHVKQLLAVDLIQVAEVAVVGGIIEQRYRVAQMGFKVDIESLNEGPDGNEEALALAEAAGDEFLSELRSAIGSGRAHLSKEDSLANPPYVRTIGTASDIRIPQEKAADFGERLNALIEEFNSHEDDGQGGVRAYLLTFYYATE
jgi:DNA-binding transcriptional ArsR family regulator